ncbi:MAG: molecular chaperone DnaJ [Herpetosiphonaceae bacterium]|nr:MAG: molecular chaperone DnaJ [Herpetosiphonaceae bacterium]
MNVTTDYYTLLGVAPSASREDIEKAYRQAIEQYDPAKLDGMADELQTLARERRRAIEAAYAVLSDADSRAAYDAEMAAAHETATELAGEAEEIDYRPLPPRRGGQQPVRPIAVRREQTGRPRWLFVGVLLTGLLALVTTATLVLTAEGRNAPLLTVEEMRALAARPVLPPAVSAEISDPVLLDVLAQQEQAITALEAQARGSTNPEDWINLGNAIFDYLELIREQSPNGQAYAAVAPRWVKATEAYSEALKLRPDDGLVRSDYALSLLRLSQAIGDSAMLQHAVAEGERALRDDPGGLRTMLNVGMVLSTDPARKEEGLKLLQAIIDRAPGSREAVVARMVLQEEMP